MEFRILGSLEVDDDGRRVTVRRGKEQALLAYLLLHANEFVPTDRLIDELWGERPTPTARKTLQNAVSQLRRAVGDDRILTEPSGYRFRLEHGELDLHRFEDLAVQGRTSGNGELLRAALGTWRGEPLASLRDELFAQRAALQLEDARLAVLEDRIDADLAAGLHAELVPELEQLIAAHPLRERPYGQLMLALYRGGRQGDALDTYRRARKTLSEEIGLEPSPRLQELERRILKHDPALAAPERAPRAVGRDAVTRPHRRRLVVAAAAALLCAGGVALLVVLVTDGGHKVPTVVANSLVKIDPRTDRVVDVIPVGHQPTSIKVVGDSVWVVNTGDETVTRFDTKSGAVDTLGTVRNPVGMAADGDRAVWISTATYESVVRVDARTFAAEQVVPLGHTTFLLAAGAGSLWVTEPAHSYAERGTVARLDLTGMKPPERFQVGVIPSGIAVGEGAAWVANIGSGSVSRIALNDGHVDEIPAGPSPGAVATGFGSVWVIIGDDKSVWRLNPVTRRPDAVINVHGDPFDIAVGEGAVWTANPRAGTVSRIDPRTNALVKRIHLGFNPQGIALGAGAIWVAVGKGPLQFPF
jgi:DNA-binding SARP family transcriptional activator/streptogramin lyase